MALTEITYTGDGSDVTFGPIPFPYLEDSDVLITINGVATTAFTIDPSTKIITFSSAPAAGTVIRVYRNTNNDTLAATFISGSAIRAVDLNDNFTQNLYVIQEIDNNAVQTDGSTTMVGDLDMGGYKVTNLAAPVAGTDAANRTFVEDSLASEVPVFYRRWSKTAAGGETSLSGNDDNGIALSYVAGSEKVFINGALQVRGIDYSGTTGTTLTGIPALIAGDIVEVHSSSNYTVGTVPDGSVTNAKVDGGAGIQYSKLALGNSIVNADVNSAAGIAASKLSFTQAGTGAVARTVDSKLTDVVSVKDFGAVGDGVADDTAAIQAAINFGGKVCLIDNATHKVTAALNLDLSTASLIGNGSVIDGSTSSTGVLNAFSSATFVQRIQKNWTHWVEGITFKGTKTAGFLLVTVGHPTYTDNSEITFRNCSFYNAGKLVNFINNAWRVNFDHCGFESPEDNYLYFNSGSNAAEVMRFSHCWFVDGTTAYIYLNEGQWFFEHCSFIGGGTGGIQVLGAAHVSLHGCNLETQPAVANQRMIEGYQSSHIVVDKCIIGLNGGMANQAPFVIQDACSLRVLNSTLPLYGADLRSETTDGRRVLVTGGSPYIVCANNYVKGTGIAGRTDWAVFSHLNNLLQNGNAEIASTTGWVASTYGTAGSTFTNVTTAPKNGTRHFLVDCVANGGIAVTQTLTGGPSFVGRTAVFGMWAKAIGGTGAVDYPGIKCIDASGAVISSFAVAVNSTDTSYIWIGGFLVIPLGTDKIIFELGGQQQAGAHSLHYDDVILNVI
jgi:hypothetical protein